MMGHREKMNGDEHDAFTGWKKLLKIFDKPGIAAKTKKRFNRRIRKAAKEDTRRALGNRLNVDLVWNQT